MKIEIGYAAGTGADALPHALAQQLARALHSEVVVVEGRPSSAGTTAAAAVAHAPADGYTLLIGTTASVTLAPLLDPALGYATQRDLCPLALVSETPHVLLVAADAQVDTLDELVARARRRPDASSYGSLGYGSSTHAVGELFAQALDLELTHVPYRSSAAAVSDLLGGHVAMLFGTLQATLPAIAAGQLRALAVSSEQRVPELKDVPTFAERGLPGLTSMFWYGLLAPCGLPRDVEGRLIEAAREAALNPDVRAVLGPSAGVPAALVGEDFGRFLQAENARWLRAVPLLRLQQADAHEP